MGKVERVEVIRRPLPPKIPEPEWFRVAVAEYGREWLREAIAYKPDDNVGLLSAVAVVAFYTGRIADARRWWQEAAGDEDVDGVEFHLQMLVTHVTCNAEEIRDEYWARAATRDVCLHRDDIECILAVTDIADPVGLDDLDDLGREVVGRWPPEANDRLAEASCLRAVSWWMQ